MSGNFTERVCVARLAKGPARQRVRSTSDAKIRKDGKRPDSLPRLVFLRAWFQVPVAAANCPGARFHYPTLNRRRRRAGDGRCILKRELAAAVMRAAPAKDARR